MLAMHLRIELRSRYVNINIMIFNGSQFSSIPLLLGQAESKDILFHSVTVAEAPEGHLVLVTGKPLLVAVESKVEDYRPNSNLHLGGVDCDRSQVKMRILYSWP